ncbi:hypothetical protein M5D96_006240 [Drosophila gunungcola]|uniref:Uncharacterized protein n=1 Tax=Drosophila gunungcola TaxID=103775 RepID=A0A9P9YNJ8_9MUSC|nr:hypothetical protein M5D96_006240 [Drosophila gunungcola]
MREQESRELARNSDGGNHHHRTVWLILIHFLDVLRLLFRALFSRRRCDIYVFIKRAGEQSKCAALDSRPEETQENTLMQMQIRIRVRVWVRVRGYQYGYYYSCRYL